MTDNDEGAGERTPRRANITAISEHCHVSRGKAAELLKAAGMRRAKDGSYLFDRAVATILALLDPSRSVGHRAGGDTSALSDALADNVSALSGAKAAYEAMRTRKLALELDRIEGRSLSRDEVFATAKDIAVHIRAGLAGIGAKTANDLAATADGSEAQRIVDAAINEALLKLCDLGEYLIGGPS